MESIFAVAQAALRYDKLRKAPTRDDARSILHDVPSVAAVAPSEALRFEKARRDAV